MFDVSAFTYSLCPHPARYCYTILPGNENIRSRYCLRGNIVANEIKYFPRDVFNECLKDR